MRLAILTDVHGNAYALEAVLTDIRSTSPDAVFNLGDTVWGGADPARAWALQQEFAPPTVRGNTDEMVAGWHGDRSKEWQDWLKTQLPANVPGMLGALPTTFVAAGGEVLLAHGDLHNTWEALILHVEGGQSRVKPASELAESITDWPAARVVLVGHTHKEAVVCEGGVTFVNVGSVSRQFQGDPAARWALLEKRGAVWSVTFRRVEYDVEAAAQWALAHCFDGEREARHLRTGRFPN